MAARSKRVKSLLNSAQRTANGTQKAFMAAEDVLTSIEERERQRATRESDLANRMPAAGGRGR